MAIVILKKQQAKIGRLPLICMRCGAPALRMHRNWLEYLGRGITLCIPFCPLHRNHIKRRTYCMATGIGVAGLLCVAGTWRLDAPNNALLIEDQVPTICFISALVVFLAALLIVFYQWANGIHIAAMDGETIALAGVADAFVEAVDLERQDAAQFKMVPHQHNENEHADAICVKPPPSVAESENAIQTDARDWTGQQGPLAEETVTTLSEARDIAISLGHDYVGTEHLLLALRTVIPSVPAYVLKSLGVEPNLIRIGIPQIDTHARPLSGPSPTPQLKRLIIRAFQAARAQNSPVLRRNHLLLGLLDEPDSTAAQILLSINVRLDELRQALNEHEARFIGDIESIWR